jgi:alanyl-tRNA synthetase
MMTANEIRESFKTFFESKGHQIVPSAPMVIKDDPTLMFTNAGMNQFKDIILGNQKAKYTRVSDAQKCLRISGKHNDLEEVGHDTYHHTMFEMLGNWSFGDYFKKEAIDFAWEYLVDVLKIETDRLYATVFEGYPQEGLERDNEAAQYWEMHLPKNRIINGNRHDNFWEMGDTGPCGPCSEIHIDLRDDEERKKIDGLTLVNGSHPQVVELWNLVFMQYIRKADGTLDALPAKVIDTGMGFERLCMALQQKKSNYDTDVFQPTIKVIAKMTNKAYGKDEKTDIAMRVIADHIRTIAFSITDGQLPSNAKAGYVIRRILRRAVRYGYTFLHQKQAFLYQLMPVLIDNMGAAYPELVAQQKLITKVIKEEEESFLRTLETGIKLLDKVIAEAKDKQQQNIAGKDAFTLYDTFGFPLDLTELICRENELTVDVEAFNQEMKKQKDRARNAASVETGDWMILHEGSSEFVGYDHTTCEARILRYRQVKQKKQTLYQIVLDKTPFYAESGGQVGDCGTLVSANETVQIIDTKKENNLSIHITKKMPETVDTAFTASIDVEKRNACAANHSATHLLDQALREVLGEHVEQKGSLVSANGLRFDFSHFQKVSAEELRQVQKIVNKRIRENIALTEYRSIPMEEAKKLGAIALFGEKYGETVRVVQFGNAIEFCGGTHVQATGQIGMIKIVSESSTAAGIRRIEAVTGKAVEEAMYQMEDTFFELQSLFNNTPNLLNTVKKFMDENNDLKHKVENFMKEKAYDIKREVLANAVEKEGVKIMKLHLPIQPEIVKDIAFQIRGEVVDNMIFVAGTYAGQKPMLTVMVAENLVKEGIHAGKIIREAAKLIKGGGGGQPHFATAGGKDVEGLVAAIDKVVELAGY